jgi:hypothetical protein
VTFFTGDDKPSSDDIERFAREMLDRHGKSADALLRERANMLERTARWAEHATTVRVLSLVERLADGVSGEAGAAE